MNRQRLLLNFAATLVIVFATYMIVAAIVVVPELQEDTAAAETDIASLTTALQSEAFQLHPDPADFFREDPLKAIEDLLDRATDPATPAAHRIPAANVSKIEETLAEIAARRELIRTEHRNGLDFWAGRTARARSQTQTVFERNARRKGNTERDQHYEQILNWFEQQLRDAHRELNECTHAAEMANNNTRSWANVVSRRLRRGTLDVPKDVLLGWDKAYEQCQQRWESNRVPGRPALGGRLGPFGPVARWLIQTESLSLVSVVGLLGFGLLGATASSIIRQRGSRPADGGPLVPHLGTVIVRGLSAAMVVFLAVKGGLTVFATGSPEPSPYSLMLTCLVAAVFSEPVWEGARVYLGTLVTRWAGDSAVQDEPVPPAAPPAAPAAPATT